MEKMTNTQKHDYEQGVNDCRCGIYDKWFRYNHQDNGHAYDLGWMFQNQTTKNSIIQFIG